MKKIIYIFTFVCLLFLVGCNKSNDGTFNKVPDYFYFPIEVNGDLDFPDTIKEIKECALLSLT